MARHDLGLSSEEFYSLQPRQLDALIKRHERGKQETEFLFAQLGCLVANFSMARPKDAIQPRDLMPSQWAQKRRSTRPAKINRDFVATQIRGVMEGIRKAAKANG